MNTEKQIYIDGSFFAESEAKISVYDHGLLYGDGIFEGLRIYNGRIFRKKEHLDRLYRSAAALMLTIPQTQKELSGLLDLCVKKNGRSGAEADGYIRLLVTRGRGSLGIDPGKCEKASLIIIVADIALYPPELYEKGIPVITSSIRRNPPDSLDPRIKSLNYLNNILAKIEAKNAGCPEAVMLNHEGYVCECTVDNIFVVRNGGISTPPAADGALAGITRDTVMELVPACGFEMREESLTLYDLYTADEIFITGSGAELMPVTQVDGRSIGNGEQGVMTKKIREKFSRYVQNQQCPEACGFSISLDSKDILP